MNKVISQQEAEAYLRRRMDDQLNVHRVFQTFPGISRETWMVDGEYASGEAFNLVIRITPPNGGNCPFPLKAEYEVYQRLQDSPVPIARVLWYDEGLEFADGRDHMVRVLVEGGTDVDGIADPGPEGEKVREHACKEHASKLGILHTLDWQKYGFGEVYPAPDDPADAIRSELKHWRVYWHENKTDAFPMITEAFYWLESLVPTENVHLCLTKGNNGLGEEIWKDGSIVAMSDWELAALADPSMDWAFSQGLLDLWDRDKLLAYYTEVSGIVIDPVVLAFAEVWTSFKAIICLEPSMVSFNNGEDLRPANVTLGLGLPKNNERHLSKVIGLQDIVKARDIIKGWRDS